MGLFAELASRGHERVLYGQDAESGLRCIIAIHSTELGPALGGTRFYPYSDEAAALQDVLRLSSAMTLKNAVAGLDLGGGKAVVIGDPKTMKSERLLRALAKMVDSLGGRYLTAEDVGMTLADMDLMRRETRWVTGGSVESGGSGDPSPVTARGLFAGLRAAAEARWGSGEIAGRHVVIQGIGKVGYAYARHLAGAGCRLTVTDYNTEAAERARGEFGATVIPPGTEFDIECDVFAPCALGAQLNADTIPRLRCGLVCGSANNQLATEADGGRLAERGILYAPDFVVNAGGVINIFEELQPEGYSQARALARVDAIYDRTAAIFARARERELLPVVAAEQVARERIATVSDLRRRL
jgi:leucine dehydrogenase